MSKDVGPCKVLIWFAANQCNIKGVHYCAGSGEVAENELSTAEAKQLGKNDCGLGYTSLWHHRWGTFA